MPKRRPVDDVLVLHLASGVSVEAAAELAGVSRATAFRRLEDEVFRERVTAARSAIVERAAGHLAAGAVEASVTLRNLLGSDNNKIQLAAARAVLELGVKVRDAAEMEARLAKIERALRRMKGRP